MSAFGASRRGPSASCESCGSATAKSGDAHRDDYEAYWLAPAKAFVVATGQQLAELAPQIRAEPRVLGSILRINRDTRFARGAGPYKDHLDVWFWEGDRRRAVSGFFARLTPSSSASGPAATGSTPSGWPGSARRSPTPPAAGSWPALPSAWRRPDTS